MKKLLFFILLVFLLDTASAAHYIFCIVEDARDGTLANDREVVLWNPANGIDDNLTDIIGPNGNSGADNIYFINCELLQTSCNVGDEMRVKVMNETGDYITDYNNLTVTGFGSDLMENLTLNSPTNSSLVTPGDYSNVSDQIVFNCSAEDLDGNVENVTLYGNWSGGWHANETQLVSGSYDEGIFYRNLTEGRYEWNCLVEDNLSASNFSSQNNTFTVDLTDPVIDSVFINESYVCGDSYVRVNCTATDALTSIDGVIIEAISSVSRENYTASSLVGDTYYADIWVNETGEWRFNCIVNDSANNTVNLTSEMLFRHPSLPDLSIHYYGFNLNDYNPLENVGIIANATVENLGCSDANNFLVGFYNGDPDSGGIQIGENQTISVIALTNNSVNITWTTQLGPNNIFVDADVGEIIGEYNESNNKVNLSIHIGAWQDFYGNVSVDKLLSDYFINNLSLWVNESSLGGSVFITDQEADVDWLNLQSIGRNSSGAATSDDFIDVDTLLGMGSYNDSVASIFTTDGNTPRALDNFIVHNYLISNIPVINSTNNSNFFTGILWDVSDDDDGEYSQEDEEDLIFVSSINKMGDGKYGRYDYEIKVPVKLREYDPTDAQEIYFYYDLF